jgi:hypothetical protein
VEIGPRGTILLVRTEPEEVRGAEEATMFFELLTDVVEWVGDLFDGPAGEIAPTAPSGIPSDVTAASGAASAGAAGTLAMPPLDSGTRAVLDMTSQSVADSHLVYQDAMAPGTVPAADLDAVQQRLDNATRLSGLVQGMTAAQEIANDVAHAEFVRSTRDAAHELGRLVTRYTGGEA